MADKRIPWHQVSLKWKVLVWFTVILILMALTAGAGIVFGQAAFDSFDLLLQDNAACYNVQEALETEWRAFESYARNASQENRKKYETACRASAQSLEALPFDYEAIGEERYARTWNLLHGYAGYCDFRDAVIRADNTAEGYAEELYRVMDMQENLSAYALRLVEATLEDNSRAYAHEAEQFGTLPFFLVILLLVAILVTAYVMQLLSASVVRPVLRMAQESRRIAENDFSGPDLRVESRDEVGELTRAVNRMKHAMRQYIEAREALHREEMAKLELEKNLEQTRLEMLKSQVNPHFLFNTLNMISCMARLEDAETTDRMILSLGNLFRYNLRTKAQEVYLEQEIEALDHYIYLQQMRFDGRITYQKLVQVDPAKVRIPAFTLQPIVENAFAHGLQSKETGGRILLRIWQEGRYLILSVVDNGRGMDARELAELDQRMQESEATGKGIGLGNLRRRVAMLYPDGALRIYSKPGRGTVIQLKIPQNVETEGLRNDV